MRTPGLSSFQRLVPPVFALLCIGALAVWAASSARTMSLRVPGTDKTPAGEAVLASNPVLAGKLVRTDVPVLDLPGAWPRFRGANFDGASKEAVTLSKDWNRAAPRQAWELELGEGYAGAAVLHGRVYLLDYDQEKKQDLLRCLALSDGRELWRYSYHVLIKRNHGMSRTVPALTDKYVVALGPKCHVICADAITGQLQWGLDLVRQFGATVPPWYAGQCPLIDQNAVILAPGGKEALLISIDLATGKTLWQTPNPHLWKMTHSSVTPMQFGGQRMYIYCANNGVVGVCATNGSVLWQTTDWKISLATVPSPLILDEGKIFLTGGYNAGSLMLQLTREDGNLGVRPLFKLPPEIFGATQHTPLLYQDHLYGVRADGKFVCLDLDGKLVWSSGSSQQFGLGSFVLGDGAIFALNDSGLLRVIEATPVQYHLIAQAQILHGRESWAPMALAGGRLIARDFTRMVCLDLNQH